MAPVEHAVASEELMAYLDGETSNERSAAIAAHVTSCETCQRLVAELRRVSRDLAGWRLESAPGLKSPRGAAVPAPRLRRWNLFAGRPALAFSMASAAVLVVAAAVMWENAARYSVTRGGSAAAEWVSQAGGSGGGGGNRARDEAQARALAAAPQTVSEAPQRTERVPQAQVPARPPDQKIVHTVELTMVARDFSGIRPEIDRILRSVGGFVGQMDASGEPPSLTATLRIPSGRLETAVAALRGLGRVVHETRSADDVTEQSVDLDARLANSRNTEQRLRDVLQNRTGRVADVLEVEREIARVREEIERLDAERANLDRRVTYATVTLRVTEERQATLDIGPVPLRLQLRNALVDGLRDAASGVMDLLLWALRAGPTLLLWVAVLWWPARRLLRAWRQPKTAAC